MSILIEKKLIFILSMLLLTAFSGMNIHAQTTSCNCGIQNALHFEVSVPAHGTSSTYLHRLRFRITPIPPVISLSTVYQIKPPGSATSYNLTLNSATFQQLGLTNWYVRCYVSGAEIRVDVAGGYEPVAPYGPEDDLEQPLGVVYQGTPPNPQTWQLDITNINTLSLAGINTVLESWNYRNGLSPQWSDTRIGSVSTSYISTITNTPCNTAPIVSALVPNPATGAPPLSVAFSATATSANTDGNFTFVLDHGNSTQESIPGTYNAGASAWEFQAPTPAPYSYATPGIYFASIYAKDKYDTPSASSAPVQITVADPVKPICGIAANKSYGTATETGSGSLAVTFNSVMGFPSGCSAAPTPCAWSFDDGAGSTSTQENPSYSFYYKAAKDIDPADGIDVSTYNVTLAVTGTCGVSDSAEKQILVYRNLAPVSDFSISTENRLVNVTLTFNGSSSTDPNSSVNLGGDGSVASYAWQIQKKDATGAYVAYGSALPNAAIAQKTFSDAGKYRVILNVTDDKGLVNASPKTVDFFIYRNPKEIAVVIDHSGSMTMGGKWETAMTSAELFINILNGLDASLPAYAQDKLGIVSYAGFGSAPPFCTTSIRATPGYIINGSMGDVPLYTNAAAKLFDFDALTNAGGIFNGQPFGMTPTGEAVAEALDGFNNYPAAGGSAREKYIVLLTDGQNNSGFYDLNFTAGGTCDVPNYLNSFANQKIRDTKIFSVVVGEDTMCWPDEVWDLSDRTDAAYRTTDNPGDVVDYFTQILSTAIDGNTLVVNPVTNGGTATINYPEDKIIFACAWKRSDNTGGPYFLRATNGTAVDPSSSFVNVVKSAVGPNDSYGFYIIDNPANYPTGSKSNFAGTWTLDLVKQSGGSYVPATVASAKFYAIADLHLNAQFALDKAADNTITLTAKITEDGSGVPKADVRVKCNLPVQAIGEILSIYPFPVDLQKKMLAAYTEKKLEPPSLPYLHASIALKELKQDRIKTKDLGIQLKDDGKNGDEKAGDGIYTVVLKDPEFEGNYIFDFVAKGTSPKKLKYERKGNLATYISPIVDSRMSAISSLVNPKPLPDKMRQMALIMIFKDKFKQRLGPYNSHLIKFKIEGKGVKLDKGVIYNFEHKQGGGGAYIQNFIFDEKKIREFKVTLVIQGKELKIDESYFRVKKR